MTNLIINIRFWYYHFQVTKGFKKFSFSKNEALATTGLIGKPKIKVCKFFNLI